MEMYRVDVTTHGAALLFSPPVFGIYVQCLGGVTYSILPHASFINTYTPYLQKQSFSPLRRKSTYSIGVRAASTPPIKKDI